MALWDSSVSKLQSWTYKTNKHGSPRRKRHKRLPQLLVVDRGSLARQLMKQETEGMR